MHCNIFRQYVFPEPCSIELAFEGLTIIFSKHYSLLGKRSLMINLREVYLKKLHNPELSYGMDNCTMCQVMKTGLQSNIMSMQDGHPSSQFSYFLIVNGLLERLISAIM